MALVKHPEHGNKHVTEEEATKLVAEGWVKWPRTPEEKGPRRENRNNLSRPLRK